LDRPLERHRTAEGVPLAGDVAVRLEGVGLTFGAYPAVRNVDLAIPAGQFAAIVGPTGCGKSSLLNLVAGLTAPSAGRITVGGGGGRRSQPAGRLHVPGRGVAALEVGAGQRPARARPPRRRPPVGCPGGTRVAAAGGARGIRGPLSPPAVRRPAKAGCDGPGADQAGCPCC